MCKEWRPIAGFSHYEVSNLGRIRSVTHVVRRPTKGSMVYKSVIRKPRASNAGYLRVGLVGDDGIRVQKPIHRAVAEAFIPNPDNKCQVNHINGDKLDNRASNLEWATPSENSWHRANALGHHRDLTELHERKKRPVIVDGEHMFESLTEAAEFIGGTESGVCSVLRGRYRTTHGHTVEYA